MSPQAPGVRSCIWLAMSVVLAASVAACASRQATVPPAPTPPPTRDIEAFIERGCFHCLEQALTLADQRSQPQLAFEAAALLALRAIELGMPSEDWLAKARALTDGNAIRAEYLEMVAAVPPDQMRGLREDLLVETQIRKRIESRLTNGPTSELTSGASWYDVLQAGPHSEIFRRYLELTLICSVDRRQQERVERFDALVPQLPDVPLLMYRIGICDVRHQAQLRAARTEVPELVDADYALARHALRDPERPDQDAAMRLYRSAAAAFPTSTSMPTAIGNLYQLWEDWASALTAFDQALALLPSHPDALLGRVISLSHLERHAEAIASATQLIDGGRWHLGQAFYWRAWNYFTTGDNHAARSDADRTRTLMVNPAVFVLSGLIEWRSLRRESAETEFQEALKMDFGQCEAAFYLGGVRAELTKLPEGIAALNQARQCFDLALAVRRKMLDETLAGAGTPEQKAREAAKHQRSIADVQKRSDEVLAAIERLQKTQTSGAAPAPTSQRSLQSR